MRLERDQIENGLEKKGFIRDNKDHRFFRLVVNGKITGIKTWTSHGTKYKVIGDSLINTMRKELRLQTNAQFLNLINCPMEYETYVALLRSQNLRL